MTQQFHFWVYIQKNRKQSPEETFVHPCSAALSLIAKMWKQPKCPLTGEWIRMWYMHTMEYFFNLLLFYIEYS